MTRLLGFVLLAGCIPLTTSTTTSTTKSSSQPRPTGQQAPVLDERAAMYEREDKPITAHEQPGVPLDPTPRPCVAAQNHCMRGGWFLSKSSASQGPQRALPAVPTSDTEWQDYRGTKLGGELIDWGHPMRTVPATVKTLKWGRPAIVFCPRPGTYPANEAEMLTSPDWYLVVAESIDEAAGTISIGVDQQRVCPEAIPIANVRAIVEFRY